MSEPETYALPDDLDELFGFSAARKRAEEAQLVPVEDPSYIRHRIFINHVDTFNAKHIAAFITDQIYGASKITGGMDEGAEQAIDEEPKEEVKPITGDKYEVVGTLSVPFHHKTEDILFTIDENDPSFTQEIMKCGFVIYDITQDANEIPKALTTLAAIEEEILNVKELGPKTFRNFAEERVFILISTVMTWAKTKPLDPDDPELAFSEIDYKKRKPHPNYKEHIACEREVVLKGRKFKDKLKTYVVCCGLVYGQEEEDLEFLFRMAWYHEKTLPVFQPGKNFVPLIHVTDLAKVLHGLMENTPPKPQFILAVEQTPSTLRQIVKALAKQFGSGKIKDIGVEEAFLYKEINQHIFERCTINLNMEPVFIVENLQIEWQNEANLPENMAKIVAEYRESRRLKSTKIVLHGPPASGKTTLAKELCKRYGLHYVSVKTMIEETLDELRENIDDARAKLKAKEEKAAMKAEAEEEEDEEEEEVEEEEEEVDIEELEDQLRDIQGALGDSENGKLPDGYVIRLMKRFLSRNICQNQGYVLDGYPKTLQQAREIFGGGGGGAGEEEFGEEEAEGGEGGGRNKLLPGFVISLEADDDFLCERVMTMSEETVQGTHYSEESMLRRLAEFRMFNTEDNTMLNFFDEMEIHPVLIDVTQLGADPEAGILETVENCLGPPVGFALTVEDEKELIRLAEEQERMEQEKSRLETEINEQHKLENFLDKMEQWTDILTNLQMEEEKVVTARAKNLRKYLIDHVFPTVTNGLIEVAKFKPEDPVDFLAEYLFSQNPEGRMFDPSYTRNGETILEQYETEIQPVLEQQLDELEDNSTVPVLM